MDVVNAVALCYLHYAHSDVVPFKCCVLSGLDFEGWQLRCTLLFIQLFASRTLSCYKHDMGALSWLNALKECPAPSLADL